METELYSSVNVPRILVAVGRPDQLRVMCDMLLEQYWMVRPVRSGAEVMEQVAQALPDLIILDAIMSDLDGYGVCSALKNNPATSHIPVIILTTLNNPDSRVLGLQAGADDIISKPVCAAEIHERVLKLLQVKSHKTAV